MRTGKERWARGDNLTVLPASMLPFKSEWQRLANKLPEGNVLFVVPEEDTPGGKSMRRVARHLGGRGRQISAESMGLQVKRPCRHVGFTVTNHRTQ